MAENTEEKILDIKVRYDDAIKKIADYRTQLDGLKKKEEEYRSELNMLVFFSHLPCSRDLKHLE